MAEAVVSCSGRRAVAARQTLWNPKRWRDGETAREFLERRAGHAKPKDLLKYLRKAGRE